jgi:hypothetical protein
MIYSDHEMRDNWGDLKPNWNKEIQDFFVVCQFGVVPVLAL